MPNFMRSIPHKPDPSKIEDKLGATAILFGFGAILLFAFPPVAIFLFLLMFFCRMLD